MTTLTPERLAEIQAALASVPAPPWHWIGDTIHQGPMLATNHSGWIYVMGFARLGFKGAQPTFPVRDVNGFLTIVPARDIEARGRGIVPAKKVAVPRATYDSNTVRGIDNPVARWLEHSPQYAKELLGEVARLRDDASRVEEATGNLIDERDNFHALLDRFAAAIAPIEVIGEHSSGNDPWLNALDLVTPAAKVEALREELAEMEAVSADWAARHIGVTQELTQLREQRAALLKLHKYDELIFGGFICTHCTAEDCDDPEDNVYWPCPSLRSVGVTDEEAVAIIKAHRAKIAREAAQKAGAL